MLLNVSWSGRWLCWQRCPVSGCFFWHQLSLHVCLCVNEWKIQGEVEKRGGNRNSCIFKEKKKRKDRGVLTLSVSLLFFISFVTATVLVVVILILLSCLLMGKHHFAISPHVTAFNLGRWLTDLTNRLDWLTPQLLLKARSCGRVGDYGRRLITIWRVREKMKQWKSPWIRIGGWGVKHFSLLSKL